MATRPSASPQDPVQLLRQLQKLLPALPEPHRGALSYAYMVLNNPSLDTDICQQVGKVVHITARLSQNTDLKIMLRGEKGPLDWNTDISPNESNPHEKTFLFHILPDQMNETLRFKLVAIGNQTPLWQRGENCIVDLSQYGHIVNIEVPGVTFPDLDCKDFVNILCWCHLNPNR